MPVAKTYSDWEIKGEPFTEKNRSYIVVNNGVRDKTVRWYNDLEYARMYHEEIPVNARPLKNLLGFQKGYITLIYGEIEIYQEYLKANPVCYFNRVFGWFVHSENDLPKDLPVGLKTKILDWKDVGDDKTERLISEDQVLKVVHDLIYGESASKYQGEIGGQIEVDLTVLKRNQASSDFGISNMYYMEDERSNSYIWITSSVKTVLKEGCRYKVRAQVKAFRIFQGIEQTVLMRCICTEIR